MRAIKNVLKRDDYKRMSSELSDMVAENDRRIEEINLPADPVTGLGEPLDRIMVEIPDYPIPVQYIPIEMYETKLMQMIIKAGSLRAFIEQTGNEDDNAMDELIRSISMLRCRTDFPYWAYTCVKMNTCSSTTEKEYKG